MPQNQIKATESSPRDTKYWMEYARQLEAGSPERFEDAAKFLVGIISINLTILFTALTKLSVEIFPPGLVAVVIILWAAAVLFAFFTLFPRKYEFKSFQRDDIKRTHGEILKRKRLYFVLSVILYMGGLGLLALAYLRHVLK